jgi:hypothetical protein
MQAQRVGPFEQRSLLHIDGKNIDLRQAPFPTRIGKNISSKKRSVIDLDQCARHALSLAFGGSKMAPAGKIWRAEACAGSEEALRHRIQS